MKRILSLLIVSILILGGYSGIAETFSVRNGIEFGMSRDEVSRIEEEENGLGIPLNLTESGKEYNSCVDFKQIDERITYEPDSVAGYDNIKEIQYFFDETDLLNKIVYLWRGQTEPENYSPFSDFIPSDEMLNQYRDLIGALSDKYELIGKIEGGKAQYVDFGNPKYIDTFTAYDPDYWKYKIRDFSQYLYSYDSGYVDISAYCASQIQGLNMFSWDYVIIEYSYCSPEQVEAKLAEGQAKIDERNNDL